MSFDPDLYRRTLKLESRVTNGVPLTMSVIDAGPRDALRTLVFLHGFGGYAGYWRNQLNYFYEGSRVIAPDLRGHGLTDAPHSSYNLDELVDDVEAMLLAVGAPAIFTLVAHSFGGAVATHFVIRHPERVDKLVIIGSAVRFNKLKNAGRFLLRAPQWLLSFVLRVVPAGRRYPAGHVVHAQYRNAVLVYDGTSLLPKIKCPTLVILGERDRLFDSRDFLAIAKLIPNAQEVTMPVSAHQVMVERPDAVNRALDRFLGPVQFAQERLRRREHASRLEQERPWLKFYDGRTPYEIRSPQGPLQRHLEIAARRFSNVTALQYLHSTMSYKKLDRLANRFAEGLRKQGLQKGERVLILLPNIPQAVIAYFAVLKASGVVVFMEAKASVDEVLQRIQQVQPAVVLALTTRYKDLGKTNAEDLFEAGVRKLVFTSLREFMSWRDWLFFSMYHHYTEGHAMPILGGLLGAKSTRRIYHFIELLSFKTDRPEPDPQVDDLALIQFTSGLATGSPRAVALSHGNLMANSLQLRHWLPEARPEDERIMAFGPFSQGLSGTVNIAPMLGATVVLIPNYPHFDAQDILHKVKKYRPTLMSATPRLYQLFAQFPQIRRYGMAAVKVCVSTGSTLALEVQESFEKITRSRVQEAYQTVESGICIANPLAARRRNGSMGVPLPDVQIRVVHPSTQVECGVDEIGELWVRGPQVARQYWHSSSLTAQRLHDDWFLTGDMVKRDADGFFYFLNRIEEVMRMSESVRDWVYPRDVEEVLYELQEVTQVAVTAWHSETANKMEITAFIVARDGALWNEAQLHQWCTQHLPEIARPHHFKRVAALPRNSADKLLRGMLRGLAQEL